MGERMVTNYCQSCAILDDKLQAADRENKRMREALESIAQSDCLKRQWGDPTEYCEHCIATAALQGGE